MARGTTELITRAQRQGWDVQKTRGGHLALRGPEGQIAHIPSTPGRSRSMANSRADLRRRGLDLNDRPQREERMSATHQDKILAVLQQNPGKPFNATELASIVGIDRKQANMALYWLNKDNLKITRPNRGIYVFGQGAPVDEPAQKQDMMLDVDVSAFGDGNPTNGSTNGHSSAGSEAMVVGAVADAMAEASERGAEMLALEELATTNTVTDLATERTTINAVRMPLSVVPLVMPKGMPSVLESVSHDGKGHLISRDENGDHWISTRLVPAK